MTKVDLSQLETNGKIKKVLYNGILTDKILNSLRMETSLYDYIELLWYQIKSNEVVWVDIEGMGYGWRWMSWENKVDKSEHDMMCSFIKEECEKLEKSIFKVSCVVYETETTKVYHFVDSNKNKFRRDRVVVLSNQELYG